MNKHYYYTRGNYNICYSTESSFQCPNHENQDHVNNCGFWKSGHYVRNTIEIERTQPDKNTTVILRKETITKLQKGVKCNCPTCDSPIEFLGWRTWVENTKNTKVVANMFRTGTKVVYTKYCKTLKTRKETINRLLKKYKS